MTLGTILVRLLQLGGGAAARRRTGPFEGPPPIVPITRLAWFFIITGALTVAWQVGAILVGHSVDPDRLVAVLLWICLGISLRETTR
jgi:hypothetical protein